MAKMLSSIAAASLIAAANAAPQAVSATGDASSGCSPSYDGRFQISVQGGQGNVKRQSACDAEGALALTLSDGVLKDAQDRTGYIASNYQFQFDGPPQAGALATDGFAACSNGELALESNTTFYQCRSGDFYNLYDRNWAPQCEPIHLEILPCPGSSSGGGGGNADTANNQPVSQISDGQLQGAPITQIPSGSQGEVQPAPTTTAGHEAPGSGGGPVSQIGDGQIQAPEGPGAGGSSGPSSSGSPAGGAGNGGPGSGNGPVSQIGDGQIQAPGSGAPSAPTGPVGSGGPGGAPVSQIGDGQIQAPGGAPGGAPVSQIGDGQIQAPGSSDSSGAPPAPTGPVGSGGPGGAPVSQIGDGQIQAPGSAPSGAPVSQIGDGQIQAPVSTPSVAPISQISDGQIQAPGATTSQPIASTPTSGLVVSQISDGQIQAPTVTDLPAEEPSVVPSSGDKIVPAAVAGILIAGFMAVMVL